MYNLHFIYNFTYLKYTITKIVIIKKGTNSVFFYGNQRKEEQIPHTGDTESIDWWG